MQSEKSWLGLLITHSQLHLRNTAETIQTLGISPIRSIAMKLSNRFSAFFLTIMLATLLGCASSAKHEGTGEYIDDTVITTKVKAAIFNEPTLKSAEINVETFKGRVQLGGFVNSQSDINKAVEITRRIEGVTSVKNDMRVK